MDDKILIKLGRKIKEIRLKQSISQEKLSQLSGLHRTYIGSIERSERNVSLINIEKIANALGLKAKDLL